VGTGQRAESVKAEEEKDVCFVIKFLSALLINTERVSVLYITFFTSHKISVFSNFKPIRKT
jgi:hypothetical protein